MAVGEISGTSDPYTQQYYQPGSNDKNTLTITSYFKLLAVKLAPHGYEPKQLIDAIWAGTAAMVKNDGAQFNEAV